MTRSPQARPLPPPTPRHERTTVASSLLWHNYIERNDRLICDIMAVLQVHERYLVVALVCRRWSLLTKLPLANRHLLFHVNDYRTTPIPVTMTPIGYLSIRGCPAPTGVPSSSNPYAFMTQRRQRVPACDIRGIVNESSWHRARISWLTIRTLRLCVDTKRQRGIDDIPDVTWMFRDDSNSNSTDEKSSNMKTCTAAIHHNNNGDDNDNNNDLLTAIHSMPLLHTLVLDGCRVTSWSQLMIIIKRAPQLRHLSVVMDHTIECHSFCDWFYSLRAAPIVPLSSVASSVSLPTINGVPSRSCDRCKRVTILQQCSESIGTCSVNGDWLCRTCLIATNHRWCMSPKHRTIVHCYDRGCCDDTPPPLDLVCPSCRDHDRRRNITDGWHICGHCKASSGHRGGHANDTLVCYSHWNGRSCACKQCIAREIGKEWAKRYAQHRPLDIPLSLSLHY